MVVQHNMQAANASRMLNITAGQQAKSTEKLSSGYRINRAADDAAGLSISEKMRKQIKGLDRASTNAQDGVSAVQTAEGALTEVHSMLQRMNELAVQSANGTNSKTDRDAIQAEIDQLSEEIDRVSETTKFNETYLLKGDGDEQKTKTVTTGMTAEYKNAITKTVTLLNGKTAPTGWYKAGSSTALADDAAVKAELKVGDDGKVTLKDGTKLYKVAADTTDEYGKQLPAQEVTDADIQAVYGVQTNALVDKTSGKEVDAKDLAKYFNEDGTYKGGLQAYKTDGSGLADVGADQIANFVNVTAGTTTTEEYTGTKALELSLHVGADSTDTNKIKISIESMSAKGIGIDGLKVDTEESATKAIDTITDAIQKVSDQRSKLGAAQNRLEHTIDNLDNVVENTTSAESRIRDTDMADEMVKYSKNNILQQAGQSMLAQANQSTQGVLSLLQ